VRRILLLPLLLVCGCIVSRADSGVTNKWRDETLPAFESGTTTQSDVAHALGPPSQLINLDEQLIFYYLRERTRGRGMILIVYNESREEIVYDRAIFFFDKKGILQDFSYSLEETAFVPPYKPKEKG
jgi:hypothetical protein